MSRTNTSPKMRMVMLAGLICVAQCLQESNPKTDALKNKDVFAGSDEKNQPGNSSDRKTGTQNSVDGLYTSRMLMSTYFSISCAVFPSANFDINLANAYNFLTTNFNTGKLAIAIGIQNLSWFDLTNGEIYFSHGGYSPGDSCTISNLGTVPSNNAAVASVESSTGFFGVEGVIRYSYKDEYLYIVFGDPYSGSNYHRVQLLETKINLADYFSTMNSSNTFKGDVPTSFNDGNISYSSKITSGDRSQLTLTLNLINAPQDVTLNVFNNSNEVLIPIEKLIIEGYHTSGFTSNILPNTVGTSVFGDQSSSSGVIGAVKYRIGATNNAIVVFFKRPNSPLKPNAHKVVFISNYQQPLASIFDRLTLTLLPPDYTSREETEHFGAWSMTSIQENVVQNVYFWNYPEQEPSDPVFVLKNFQKLFSLSMNDAGSIISNDTGEDRTGNQGWKFVFFDENNAFLVRNRSTGNWVLAIDDNGAVTSTHSRVQDGWEGFKVTYIPRNQAFRLQRRKAPSYYLLCDLSGNVWTSLDISTAFTALYSMWFLK